MEITTNRPITEDILTIIKDSFEEQKGIKVLSLFVKDNDAVGIYILPPQQSLSFVEVPLLDMTTDFDGHQIFMFELGQLLQFAYRYGEINHFSTLVTPSDIKIVNDLFNTLIDKCLNNPPIHRINLSLIEWFERTDEVHRIRTESFNKICTNYNALFGGIDVDNTINTKDNDEAYILKQFRDAAQQLKEMKTKKVSEAIIYELDKIFVQLQIDLYSTDGK